MAGRIDYPTAEPLASHELERDGRLVWVGRHPLRPGHITFSRRRQEKTLAARQMERKATFRVGGMTPGEFRGSESPGRIIDPGARDRSPLFVDHPAFQRETPAGGPGGRIVRGAPRVSANVPASRVSVHHR